MEKLLVTFLVSYCLQYQQQQQRPSPAAEPRIGGGGGGRGKRWFSYSSRIYKVISTLRLATLQIIFFQLCSVNVVIIISTDDDLMMAFIRSYFKLLLYLNEEKGKLSISFLSQKYRKAGKIKK